MSHEKQIKEIMDGFDFESVHDAMTAMKWRWFGATGEGGVPTLDEIKKSARKLLEAATQLNDGWEMATGGFVAEKDGEWMRLSFTVETLSADASDQN